MTYKTVPSILLKMATNGELTTKQAANIRDAHENERAEWRNKLLQVMSMGYEYGQRGDLISKSRLTADIITGGHDV
jgi:hypothetical protein